MLGTSASRGDLSELAFCLRRIGAWLPPSGTQSLNFAPVVGSTEVTATEATVSVPWRYDGASLREVWVRFSGMQVQMEAVSVEGRSIDLPSTVLGYTPSFLTKKWFADQLAANARPTVEITDTDTGPGTAERWLGISLFATPAGAHPFWTWLLPNEDGGEDQPMQAENFLATPGSANYHQRYVSTDSAISLGGTVRGTRLESGPDTP